MASGTAEPVVILAGCPPSAWLEGVAESSKQRHRRCGPAACHGVALCASALGHLGGAGAQLAGVSDVSQPVHATPRHKCTGAQTRGPPLLTCTVRAQLKQLITELVHGGAAELGVTVPEGYVERLNAYARSVAHFPTAVKEVRLLTRDVSEAQGRWAREPSVRRCLTCGVCRSFPGATGGFGALASASCRRDGRTPSPTTRSCSRT